MKNVSQLKARMAGLLTGTDLDNVTDLDGAIEEAVRVVVQQCDPPEASGRQAYMLFQGVYDYPAPISIFGGSVEDLRPQGATRLPTDYVYKQPVALFDRTKAYTSEGIELTFEYNEGTPIMRVAQHRGPYQIDIDQMNDTSGWSAGGNASGLVLDQTVYYQTPGSLRFNQTGAGAGYLEKTLSYSLDMTSYQGVGTVFLALDVQDATNLASLNLRIGSDSSNYASLTVTEAFIAPWEDNQWMLVGFDLSGAVNTGTPDFSKIKYVRATSNVLASEVNMRFGALFASLPSPYDLLFGSDWVFKDTNGDLSDEITNDNDTIILTDPVFTILTYEASLTILLQNGGSVASGLGATFQAKLYGNGKNDLGLYARYRADNPSQDLRTIGNYYND